MVTTAKVSEENLINKNKNRRYTFLLQPWQQWFARLAWLTWRLRSLFFPLVPSYMKFWRHFSLKNAKSKCTKIKSHQLESSLDESEYIWKSAIWSVSHMYTIWPSIMTCTLCWQCTIQFRLFRLKLSFRTLIYWHLLFYVLSPRVFVPYNTRLRVIWSASKNLIQINSFLHVQIFRLVVILV